jgi:hypothetical protein
MGAAQPALVTSVGDMRSDWRTTREGVLFESVGDSMLTL